ncbi:hypothetical protein [Streptomyces sp. DSM 40907]|uniref:hypothetical protein n=1 Tax=Streptomyces kutzneri TaxID=3051179 RepID=UPI0028D07651|nr:hypothetical protein [Streptomyces sp. DSM 40907]
MGETVRAGRVPQAADREWWDAAPGAEVVFAGQLLIGIVLCFVLTPPSDDYGLGWGPGFGVLFFLLIAAVIVPVLLLGTAVLHALVFTRPALALSRRTGRWLAAPAYLLGASAACALLPWCAGAPYAASLAWIGGSSALPLLVAGLGLRGTRSTAFIGTWASVLSGVLASATLIIGLDLTDGAALGEFEPPRLVRAQYVGEWHGEDGGVVRLQEDGELVVENLPVDQHRVGGLDDVVTRCTAAGIWRERSADARFHRRAGVDLIVKDCAGWGRTWLVAGTVDRPELFQVVGDPDAGGLRILRRVTPAPRS